MACFKTAPATNCCSVFLDLVYVHNKEWISPYWSRWHGREFTFTWSISVVLRNYNSGWWAARGIIVLLSASRTTNYLPETASIQWYIPTWMIYSLPREFGSALVAYEGPIRLEKPQNQCHGLPKIPKSGKIEHSWAVGVLAHYILLPMVWGGPLMKSFAGFLRSLVVRWPNLSSWRSLTGFSGTATQFGYATTNQRGSSFIIPITHQTTTYITPGLVLWARYPGVGEMGRKMACGSWKHFSFFGHGGKIGK